MFKEIKSRLFNIKTVDGLMLGGALLLLFVPGSFIKFVGISYLAGSALYRLLAK